MAKHKPDECSTRSVEVGEYTINVRENTNASAKVVILLHGIGVSERYFRRFADALSMTYRVMNLTLPGYGDTKKPSRALDLDELAAVVAQFIRQENIVKPIVIGQSMGCQVASRLSVMDGLSIDKLLLISPTINHKERSAPLQFFRLLQDTLREPLTVTLILVVEYMKFGVWRYMRTQRYMINDRIETYLAQCTVPTLLLRGERDKIVPKGWVEFLRTILQNGSITEVASAPHNLQYTHPKEAAQLCNDFIEQ